MSNPTASVIVPLVLTREEAQTFLDVGVVVGPKPEQALLDRVGDAMNDSIRRSLKAGEGAHVDIVFDGPPGPVAGRFVEVEDATGASICFGEWVHRPDGYWALRIPRTGSALHKDKMVEIDWESVWIKYESARQKTLGKETPPMKPVYADARAEIERLVREALAGVGK